MLKGHSTNVIIKKLITSNFINNYRDFVRIKNKLRKTQLNSFYTLTKECFGGSLSEIKEGSLRETKLNFSAVSVSKNK